MATRLNRRHTESVLAKIRTSQLVNRLQDNALGNIEMTKSQVESAKFLIERTIAKAEQPRELNLTGNITLEKLITGALDSDDRRDSPSIATH